MARGAVDGLTWTLLLLVACGIPDDHPSGRASVERLLDRFTQLTYPWHWHYTVLRGLDYSRWNTLRALRVLRRRGA